MQREGFYPPPQGSSTILGVEFSGHVSEVGADVTAWAVSDEVFGLTGGVKIGRTIHNPQADSLHVFRVPMQSILSSRQHISCVNRVT